MKPTISVQGVSPTEYGKYELDREILLRMLRRMIEIRRFEERVEQLFLQEGALIGPSHLYLGQEAVVLVPSVRSGMMTSSLVLIEATDTPLQKALQ